MKKAIIFLLATIVLVQSMVCAMSNNNISDFIVTQSKESALVMDDAITSDGKNLLENIDQETILKYAVLQENMGDYFETYNGSEFIRQIVENGENYMAISKDSGTIYHISKKGEPVRYIGNGFDAGNTLNNLFDISTISKVLGKVEVQELTDIRISFVWVANAEYFLYVNTDKGEYIILEDELSGEYLPDKKLEALTAYPADVFVSYCKAYQEAERKAKSIEAQKASQKGYTYVDANGDDVSISPMPQKTKEPMPSYEPKIDINPTSTPMTSPSPTPETIIAVTSAPEYEKKKTLSVYTGESIIIGVDKEHIRFPDAQPFIDENNRTQIPIRAVAEMLDCTVDWDGDAKTVTITHKNGDTVRLAIDSNIMIVNGKSVQMDTSAIIKDERTYIPVRFVAEAMGLTVKWIK